MKKLFKLTLAGLAVIGLTSTSPVGTVSTAVAADVEWNLSVWGKRRAFTEGIEAISAYVADKSGGDFQIKIHYGDALSKSRENLDGISIGAFEMAMFCASYHPQKNRSVNVLDLPMLPVSSPQVQRAIDLAVYNHPYTIKEMERWNAKLLMSAALPQYEFFGRGPTPRKISDWEGMRVRALGGMGAAMKVLGAVPTTVTAPEVFQAIESGTVDAAAFPFYAQFSYGVNEVSSWRTTNLSPGAANCPIVINIDAWNSIPDSYQNMLNDSVEIAYDALFKAYDASVVKFEPLADAQGIERVTYTDAELADFRARAARPVWDKWVEENAKEGVPAQELLDLVLKTAKEASK